MILRRLTTLLLLPPVFSSSVTRDVTRELASELTVASELTGLARRSSDTGSRQAVSKQSSGNETQLDARHSRGNQSSLSLLEPNVTDARKAKPRGVVDGAWKSSVYPDDPAWRSFHFRGNAYACEEMAKKVEDEPYKVPELFVCKCISIGHGCPLGAPGIARCRLSRAEKDGQDFPIMDCESGKLLPLEPGADKNRTNEQLNKERKSEEKIWSNLYEGIRATDLRWTDWFSEFEKLVPLKIRENAQSKTKTNNKESQECHCTIDKKQKHWPLADHFFYVDPNEDCYCEVRTWTTDRRLKREHRLTCEHDMRCDKESEVTVYEQYNMRLHVMFYECFWGRRYGIISIAYKLFPFFAWTAVFSLAPFAYLCGEGEMSWIRVWIRRILISILFLKVVQFVLDFSAYQGFTMGGAMGHVGDYGVEILIVIVPLLVFAAWTIYFLFLSDAFDETEADHERRALQAKEAAKRKKAKPKTESIASEDEPWYASYFGGEGQSVVAQAVSSVKKTLYSFVRFYALIGLAALTIWPLTYYWLKDIGLSGNLCDLGWVVIIVVERLLFAIEALSAYVISYIPLEFLPGAETARKFERNLYNTLYFQSVWAVMFYGNIANEVNKWFSGKINGKDECPDQEMKYAARLTILYGYSVAFLHILIAVLSFTFIQDRWHDVRVDIEALVTGLAGSAKGAVGLSHDPDVDWTPPSDDDDYRK